MKDLSASTKVEILEAFGQQQAIYNALQNFQKTYGVSSSSDFLCRFPFFVFIAYMVMQNLYLYEASLLKTKASQNQLAQTFGASDAAIDDAEEVYQP